LLAFE